MAEQLPDHAGSGLTEAAREAFVAGMNATGFAGAAVLTRLAITIGLLLRRR